MIYKIIYQPFLKPINIIMIHMVLFVAVTAIPSVLAASETDAIESSSPGVHDEVKKRDNLDELSIGYGAEIFKDAGKMIVAPAGWQKDDWIKAGVVFGATGGLLLADRGIRDFSQKNQSSTAHGFAKVGNDFGNPLVILPSAGALYLYGKIADDRKASRSSLLAVESLVISNLFTQVIKETAHRERPNTGATPYAWNGPQLSSKNLSFCSGHTSAAFSMATVFAEQYKDTWYVPPIAYGLATLTGMSRIYSNEHWASDVFFGAALGYFVGQAVVKYHTDDAKKVVLVPVVGTEYKGMAVQVRF